MSPRIIWFFGPSAAGKDTLMDQIERGIAAEDLIAALNATGPLEVCVPSLDTERDRADLVNLIAQGLPACETQLVKGQTSDIDLHETPSRLTAMVPECAQSLVFVWASPATLAQRLSVRARTSTGPRAKWAARQGEAECRWEMGKNRDEVRSLDLPILYIKNDGPSLEIGAEPPD
jgi:hypothetical protein